MEYRKEQDKFGEYLVPKDALYGIHSMRARANFPDQQKFSKPWYQAIGMVKKACYLSYQSYAKAIRDKYPQIASMVISEEIVATLINSAEEVAQGQYFEHFIVPAISGGAGTSINMNVNEIIANAALLKLGKHPGDYDYIDPIEHANIFQSTNDVIPTSLKLVLMQMFKKLEEAINALRKEVEKIEQDSRNDLRIAYTQMQEAVPTSFGNLFSSYNDALSRDWWRVSKCFERIKVVNLGGTAVGTGITASRFYIMDVVQQLQQLSQLPITRSENLSDATSNLDSLVEVHAVMKSLAVNLEKIVGDIRLLSSDLFNLKELTIPQKQVGSSIMPGKVNPVIPEYVVSVAHRVYANDGLISNLSAQGCLELNAYIPIIGNAMLESIELLIGSCNTLRDNLFVGLKINKATARQKLFNSPSVATALVSYIGYNKAAEMATYMKEFKVDIFQANKQLQLISDDKLKSLLRADNLLKMGYTVSDII